MALINCSECRGKFSDTAAACPHCAAPIDVAGISHSRNVTLASDPVGKFMLVIAGVIGLLFFYQLVLPYLSAQATRSSSKSVSKSNTPIMAAPTQTAAPMDRLAHPYWDQVFPNQRQARIDLESGRSHFVDGRHWEILYDRIFNTHVSEKDGYRFAMVRHSAQSLPFPMEWKVDCKNMTQWDAQNQSWYELQPETQGARLAVTICRLPTRFKF